MFFLTLSLNMLLKLFHLSEFLRFAFFEQTDKFSLYISLCLQS